MYENEVCIQIPKKAFFFVISDIIEMASSRPTSMIISASVFDETNTNGSKTLMQKKETQSLRLINQPKLPINNIIHHAHSSSSSIDSTGAKNAILLENKSLPQVNSTTTISSTTTDSEYDSEQEERYIDDNNLLDSNNLPIELKKQKLSSYDSSQQKLDENMQEQLSRRDKHFRKLFKSDIPDDMPELIDSYVCAYQGKINRFK